jgi:hypothetical protein
MGLVQHDTVLRKTKAHFRHPDLQPVEAKPEMGFFSRDKRKCRAGW